VLAEPAGNSASAAIIKGPAWKDPVGNPITAHEGEPSWFDGVFY